MVERLCRAMHDCHKRDEHSMTWDGWLAGCQSENELERENASEWVEARRLEARAAIAAMREPTQPMVDKAWAMIGSNLRYEEVYRYLVDAALEPSSAARRSRP